MPNLSLELFIRSLRCEEVFVVWFHLLSSSLAVVFMNRAAHTEIVSLIDKIKNYD